MNASNLKHLLKFYRSNLLSFSEPAKNYFIQRKNYCKVCPHTTNILRIIESIHSKRKKKYLFPPKSDNEKLFFEYPGEHNIFQLNPKSILNKTKIFFILFLFCTNQEILFFIYQILLTNVNIMLLLINTIYTQISSYSP